MIVKGEIAVLRVTKHMQQGYQYFFDQSDGIEYAISNATGEVMQAVRTIVPVGSVVYTPEDLSIINMRKEQYKNLCDQKGNYSRFCFVSLEAHFEDITSQSAARVIYLSTFLKYGTNELHTENGRRINCVNLHTVLGLSMVTTYGFLNEVCPRYVQKDKDGKLFMDKPFFRYGRITTSTAYQKIFIKAVRKLYRTVCTRNHRHLGYVFQMLPYVNIEYNILCRNILEKDLDNVQQISDKEFCDMIGYDYSAISRLKKIYRSIRFDVEGHTGPFCVFVDTGDKTKVCINPRVLYSGSSPEKVEIIGSFCKDA